MLRLLELQPHSGPFWDCLKADGDGRFIGVVSFSPFSKPFEGLGTCALVNQNPHESLCEHQEGIELFDHGTSNWVTALGDLATEPCRF